MRCLEIEVFVYKAILSDARRRTRAHEGLREHGIFFYALFIQHKSIPLKGSEGL